MKRVTGSLGVAGRLAILLGGLAAVSTGLALLLQDRALDKDLREAARARLSTSASVADRLIADHLEALAMRYSAISRTPELRANLDARHTPTLIFYATRLLRDQGATLIAFVGEDGQFLATAGDPRLMSAALARTLDRGDPRPACVSAGTASKRGGGGRDWMPCAFPEGPGEASLFEAQGNLYSIVAVPLRTNGRLDGGLIAVEAVGEAMLQQWSELSGAAIRSGPPATEAGALDALVRTLPGIEMRVSTTYDAERGIIERSRYNLAVSGALAVLLAIVASLVLARAFMRPIRKMREATERLSEGHLDHRVEIEREDEFGELGHAFNELASRLTRSQDRVRRAQRLARFGNWYLDVERKAFDGTSEFRRLMRLPEVGAIAIDALLARVHHEDRTSFRTALAESARSGRAFQVDIRVATTDGRDRILQVRGSARATEDSRLEGSIQDITESREAEEQIRYLSMHDPLTGLGNRDHAVEELEARVARRGAEPGLTAIVVGIDDLRGVIDTFGHAVGDEILLEVARRLVGDAREAPRSGEREPDIVAKLGDNRFAVILDGTETEAAERAAARLLSILRRPYRVGDEEISLTPSFGIARWPLDSERPDRLLRSAETALGRVQTEDRGGIRFFHGSMHEDASRRLRIANLLRRAIDDETLELHYQPRIRPDTGHLIGFEALSRWTDPELGPVSPAEFIQIAEATGSIHTLGAWCIRTASEQLRRWHDGGFEWVSVSLNLSRHQLKPELVDLLLEATLDLDRSRLELEVTESALIEEGDAAIETLTTLRGFGFKIALDDFGTGYSSLSYLRGLPIDTVKLDRSFIRDIAEDPDAAALTGSVLAMCRALRLHGVVEGVETEAQLEILVGLGVTEVQGFLFSQALPVDESSAYLESATPAEPDAAAVDLPI